MGRQSISSTRKCDASFSAALHAGKHSTSTLVGWGFLWVIFFGLALAGAGAYAVYKYRLRVKKQLCSTLQPFFFSRRGL
jgi:hypothetical protein